MIVGCPRFRNKLECRDHISICTMTNIGKYITSLVFFVHLISAQDAGGLQTSGGLVGTDPLSVSIATFLHRFSTLPLSGQLQGI